jgi:hypothetical protein
MLTANLPSSVGSSFFKAPVGQTWVQAMHKMQPRERAVICGVAKLPKPCSKPDISMHLFGQTLAHWPQPMQASKNASSEPAPGGRKYLRKRLPAGSRSNNGNSNGITLPAINAAIKFRRLANISHISPQLFIGNSPTDNPPTIDAVPDSRYRAMPWGWAELAVVARRHR